MLDVAFREKVKGKYRYSSGNLVESVPSGELLGLVEGFNEEIKAGVYAAEEPVKPKRKYVKKKKD